MSRETYSDELFVLGIIAVLSKDTKNGLFTVEALANLVEALNET